jgi:hypothetical protein
MHVGLNSRTQSIFFRETPILSQNCSKIIIAWTSTKVFFVQLQKLDFASYETAQKFIGAQCRKKYAAKKLFKVEFIQLGKHKKTLKDLPRKMQIIDIYVHTGQERIFRG